ncbi:hypothetical protein CJU90_4200 [Yarrowia sp. C11]|nr:hypothetical protein CKK34_6816 [Yarrowia sp. E02]KAG5365142.1 hypothetical protein CJU90_4200 [Yarrowia sp. C11]
MYRWNNEDDSNLSMSSVPPFGTTNLAAFSPINFQTPGNSNQTEKADDSDAVSELIVSDDEPFEDEIEGSSTSLSASTTNVRLPDTSNGSAVVIQHESVQVTHDNGVVIQQSVESQTVVMTTSEAARGFNEPRIQEIIEPLSEAETAPGTASRPDLPAPVVLPTQASDMIPSVAAPSRSKGKGPRRAVVVRKPYGARQVAPLVDSQEREMHASQPEHSQSRYEPASVHMGDSQDPQEESVTSEADLDVQEEDVIKFPTTVEEAEAEISWSLRASRAKAAAQNKISTKETPKKDKTKGKEKAKEKAKEKEKRAAEKRAAKEKRAEKQAAREKRDAEMESIARWKRDETQAQQIREAEAEEKRVKERQARGKAAKKKRIEEAACVEEPEIVVIDDSDDEDESEEGEGEETLVPVVIEIDEDEEEEEEGEYGEEEERELSAEPDIELDENGIPTDPRYGIDFSKLQQTDVYQANMKSHKRWSKTGGNINEYLVNRKRARRGNGEHDEEEPEYVVDEHGDESMEEDEAEEDAEEEPENFCDFSKLVKTERYRKNMEREGYVLDKNNKIITRKKRRRSTSKARGSKARASTAYDKFHAAEQAKVQAKVAFTRQSRFTRALVRVEKKEAISNSGASTSATAGKSGTDVSTGSGDEVLSMSDEFPPIVYTSAEDELKQVKGSRVDDPEDFSDEDYFNL